MKSFIVAAMFPLVAGCATMFAAAPVPGERIESVQARKGAPSAIIQDGADTLYEYNAAPSGQYSWMARFGPDGVLRAYEQVLTDEKFATIRVGVDHIDQVVRTIGHPAERSYLPLRSLHVWSYRYKQAHVWDSMMHVHFDKDGIVRDMMAGPDPDRELKLD